MRAPPWRPPPRPQAHSSALPLHRSAMPLPPSLLGKGGAAHPRPWLGSRSPLVAPGPPAASAVQQGPSQGSRPPAGGELEVLLSARRLSRARLAAEVQREQQRGAEERAALQRQLEQSRIQLEQAGQAMDALRAALRHAEEEAERAHQERAALLKELKLERAEKAGAAQHATAAERRCQVGEGRRLDGGAPCWQPVQTKPTAHRAPIPGIHPARRSSSSGAFSTLGAPATSAEA